MEHAEKVFTQLDDIANTMPEFKAMCDKQKLRPGHIMAGVLGLVTVIGVWIKGYDIICALLTCVYPMIMSIRAVESKADNDDKKWLCFWTVFGIFQTVEMFIGFILAFIPYYYWLRLAFFIFMMSPQTNGAEMVYEKVFAPVLKEHKKEIEEFIEQVKGKASKYGEEALNNAKDLAREASS